MFQKRIFSFKHARKINYDLRIKVDGNTLFPRFIKPFKCQVPIRKFGFSFFALVVSAET